jgi:hypothetical protein
VANNGKGGDIVQLQRLTTQLEEARSAVGKLQQYESLYKETRMRSKQMQAEVSALQVRKQAEGHRPCLREPPLRPRARQPPRSRPSTCALPRFS